MIGSGAVSVDGPITGTWAYTLRNIDAEGHHWIRLDLSARATGQHVATDEWRRFHASQELRRAVAAIVAPGTTIIVTPDSLVPGGEPIDVLEGEPAQKD